MDLHSSAKKYLHVDDERLHAMRDEERISFSALGAAIVFVWATWSGKAQLAIRALGKALAGISDLKNVQVYILDHDLDSTTDMLHDAGEEAWGNGETYWVRDGRIAAKMSKYGEADCVRIVQLTNDLLHNSDV